MVEHRSPKPSMGVRIPHPLYSKNNSYCCSFFVFYINHWSSGQILIATVLLYLVILTVKLYNKNSLYSEYKRRGKEEWRSLSKNFGNLSTVEMWWIWLSVSLLVVLLPVSYLLWLMISLIRFLDCSVVWILISWNGTF